MADLLVAVSTCRSLHFYEVVPLAELLQVMAVDAPAVSARVQSILLPSYFPGPEEGAARVAALLKANPAAGKACKALPATGRGGRQRACLPPVPVTPPIPSGCLLLL